MRKKTKKRRITPRLPMETVKLLRSKGGVIKPKKGGGYNRKAEKKNKERDW